MCLSPAAQTIQIEEDQQRLRPIDANLQVPDTRKFSAHTGWRAEIPFAQTMQDLLDYWRQRVASTAVFINR